MAEYKQNFIPPDKEAVTEERKDTPGFAEQDAEETAKLWLEAAERGEPSALYCHTDAEKAIEWYTKAAEQGDAEAQYKLGKCYYISLRTYPRGPCGVGRERYKKNAEKAVEWCTKAANQGHAEAQYELGWYYALGKSH